MTNRKTGMFCIPVLICIISISTAALFISLISCTERKQELKLDLDGDSVKENITIQTVRSRAEDSNMDVRSLRLTVRKSNGDVLKQELDRGFNIEESFVQFRDITGDGKMELVTRTRLGHDCAGCDAYRIYTFEKDGFTHAINLFSIDKKDSMIRTVLRRLPDIREELIDLFNRKARENCGCTDDVSDCSMSEPWLLDTDRDGSREIVQLIGSFQKYDTYYGLCILELSPEGTPSSQAFYLLLIPEGSSLSFVGFMKVRYNRTHLLLNYFHPGTSIFHPVLHVLEIHGTYVREIGKFAGFYPHVIPERLRDLNGDGSTEIIFVDDYIWPSGEAHADVVPVYGIAEYVDGEYKVANEKFKRDYEELNGFSL